jgi:hypothetical protein
MHTQVANGLLHELHHEQGIDHHHEDDGSIHYDASEESKEHVQQQCTSPCQFLLPGTATVAAHQLPPDALPPARATFIPDPDLEDPERPPVFAPGTTAGG